MFSKIISQAYLWIQTYITWVVAGVTISIIIAFAIVFWSLVLSRDSSPLFAKRDKRKQPYDGYDEYDIYLSP